VPNASRCVNQKRKRRTHIIDLVDVYPPRCTRYFCSSDPSFAGTLTSVYYMFRVYAAQFESLAGRWEEKRFDLLQPDSPGPHFILAEQPRAEPSGGGDGGGGGGGASGVGRAAGCPSAAWNCSTGALHLDLSINSAQERITCATPRSYVTSSADTPHHFLNSLHVNV
jgi:hypothetical protein